MCTKLEERPSTVTGLRSNSSRAREGCCSESVHRPSRRCEVAASVAQDGWYLQSQTRVMDKTLLRQNRCRNREPRTAANMQCARGTSMHQRTDEGKGGRSGRSVSVDGWPISSKNQALLAVLLVFGFVFKCLASLVSLVGADRRRIDREDNRVCLHLFILTWNSRHQAMRTTLCNHAVVIDAAVASSMVTNWPRRGSDELVEGLIPQVQGSGVCAVAPS